MNKQSQNKRNENYKFYANKCWWYKILIYRVWSDFVIEGLKLIKGHKPDCICCLKSSELLWKLKQRPNRKTENGATINWDYKAKWT